MVAVTTPRSARLATGVAPVWGGAVGGVRAPSEAQIDATQAPGRRRAASMHTGHRSPSRTLPFHRSVYSTVGFSLYKFSCSTRGARWHTRVGERAPENRRQRHASQAGDHASPMIAHSGALITCHRPSLSLRCHPSLRLMAAQDQHLSAPAFDARAALGERREGESWHHRAPDFHPYGSARWRAGGFRPPDPRCRPRGNHPARTASPMPANIAPPTSAPPFPTQKRPRSRSSGALLLAYFLKPRSLLRVFLSRAPLL